MRRIELDGPEATRALGQALARAVKGGLCILLRGELGAGKTTLCQGFIEDRTGIAYAPSPTFTLLQAYPGGLYHLDLYRLAQADLREFDMEEIFAPDALLLVEWPERAEGDWPPDRLEIRLAGEGEQRVAELAAKGPAAEEALDRLGWPA
jgi:tRNA threonylcarbamoyl adenosine modification protein YjeE